MACHQGFTLLELLVAGVVFLIIVGVVLKFADQTSQIWRGATSKIQVFQEARAGFDAMTRNLAQANLNAYYDYYNTANVARASITSQSSLASFVPHTYDRMSDLHFVSGQASILLASSVPAAKTQTHAVFFQAPKGYSVAREGLDEALNACGYFLQFDDGSAAVPDFVTKSSGFKKRYRFRMMEMTQDSDELAVYNQGGSANDWFAKKATANSTTGAPNSRVIAENVIALVLLPTLPERQDDPSKGTGGVALAPRYNFSSRVPLGASNDPAWASASPPFPGDGFSAVGSDNVARAMTRHHQLPPVIKAILVVLDEASASRLQGNGTTVPAAIDLSRTGLFTQASKLKDDLQTVEDICNAKPGNLTGNTLKLNYRVFSTDIILRQAKWSNK